MDRRLQMPVCKVPPPNQKKLEKRRQKKSKNQAQACQCSFLLFPSQAQWDTDGAYDTLTELKIELKGRYIVQYIQLNPKLVSFNLYLSGLFAIVR